MYETSEKQQECRKNNIPLAVLKQVRKKLTTRIWKLITKIWSKNTKRPGQTTDYNCF